jgi:malonyl-CoA/methylmalonyl-CoA synthetase
MLPKFDASAVWANLLGVNMSNSERPTVFMAVPTIYSKLIDEYQRKIAGNPKLKEYVKSTCSSKMRLLLCVENFFFSLEIHESCVLG